MVPPTEPCALRSTQPLKVRTSDFSWCKGGRCFWLTTYHRFSAETSRKSGALTYPEPLGPPRPVEGHLYFTFLYVGNSIFEIKVCPRFVRKVKNVCAYNPRSCFIVPDQSCSVFSTVLIVTSCCWSSKLFHPVSVTGCDNERADIKSRRLWGARRVSVFAGGKCLTQWNSPKTCYGLWRTCYERGQCPKMVHNV